MADSEQARKISIRSRAMVGDKPLWDAELVVGLLNKDDATDVQPHRAVTVRVLAQGAGGKIVKVETGAGNAGDFKNYHPAILLHAAVRPRGGTDAQTASSTLTTPFESQSTISDPEDAPHGKLRFSDVTLLSPDDVLVKHSPEIELPDQILDSGEIPVLVKKTVLNAEDVGGKCFVFKRESQMQVSHQGNRIKAYLTPDGIEFDAIVTNPFGVSGAVASFNLRMQLSYDNSRPAGGADPVGYVVRAVGGQDALAFRTAFDTFISAFDSLEALQLLVAPGPAPVAWNPKTAPVIINGATEILVDPKSLDATLLTSLDPAWDFPRSCRISAGKAWVKRGVAAELTLQSALVPLSSPQFTLQWDGEHEREPLVSFGQPTATEERLTGILETEDFGARLQERYVAAGVLLPDAAVTRPLYAFLPLERGVLQLPLPTPDKTTQPVPAPRREAFVGSITVRKRLGRAGIRPSAFSATVQLVAAGAAKISASFVGGKPVITASLYDAVGKVTGLVFAAGTSPSPDEIVPPLDAGPMATEPLDIVVGNAGADGWSVNCFIRKGANQQPTSLETTIVGPSPDVLQPKDPVIAWLAHPRLALVASMPMTRTRKNPSRPSQSRDLVPHFHLVELTSGRWTKPLTLKIDLIAASAGTHGLPSLSGLQVRNPADAEPKWPWPSLGKDKPADFPPPAGGLDVTETSDDLATVSLASLTLPGVEFGRGNVIFAFNEVQGSLRFDLPLHGELHASAATPKAPSAKKAADQNSDPAPTALDLEVLDSLWQREATRLALTRTMNDRMTSWIGVDAAQTPVRITGLLEPYLWNPPFKINAKGGTGELPLGSYSLANHPCHGSDALAGLTARFQATGSTLTLDPNGSITVVGFSVTQQNESGDGVEWQFDTRGVGHAQEPLRSGDFEMRRMSAKQWRQQQNPPTLNEWWAISAASLRFEYGGIPLGLRLRDLPVIRNGDGEFIFKPSDDGTLPGVESLVSPDGRMLRREHLDHAVYEWSFFQRRVGAGSFVITLGPLRFRPLRLAKIGIKDGALSWLEVIGCIEPPQALTASESAAFVDDDPYTTGNLVQLAFDVRQGVATLSAVKGVEIETSGIVIRQKASVSFNADARVYYGVSKKAAKNVAVKLAFELSVADGKLSSVPASGELSATLFGASLTLRKGTVKFTPSLRVEFSPASSPDPASGFVLGGAALDWDVGQEGLRLKLEGMLAISPHPTGTELPVVKRRLVEWRLGTSLRWFGVAVDLAEAGDPVIDHTNGVLRITCQTKALLNDPEFLQGWPVNGADLTLQIAIAISVTDEPTWPKIALTAGFVEAQCTKPDGLEIAHRMTAAKTGTNWESKLSVSCNDATLNDVYSAVEWPLDNLKNTELAQVDPASHVAQDWLREIAVSSATRYRHKVKISLQDVELDCMLLGSDADYNKLVKPWTFPAVTDHALVGDQVSLEWTAVDEVVIGDLNQFLAEAIAAVIGDSTDSDAVKNAGYAFAPRYGDAVKDLRKQSVAYAPSAGIYNKALARAGLPAWEMVNAVYKSTLNRPGQPAVAGLFIAGASIIDVTTRFSTLKAPAEGATIVTPWLQQLNTGDRKAKLGPLKLIPQAPSSGGDITLVVSTFDLAPQLKRRLAVEQPVQLPTGVGSVTVLKRAIDALTRRPPGVDAKHLVQDYTPVSQAVTTSFEHKFDPTFTPEAYLERPIWLRTILAWKAVKDAYGSHGLLESPDGIPVPLADNVSTVALLDPTAAERLDKASRQVVRLAPPRGAAERLAALAGGQKATARFDLLILSRNEVHILGLPDIGVTGEVDARLIGPRLLHLAFTATTDPLAIGVAELADPDPFVLDSRRLHGKVTFIELPRFLADPPATHALRRANATLFGSPAMGWPRPAERLGLDHAAPHIGPQRPLQDRTHSWAGEARSLSVGARAWAADESFDAASVFAIGQKALFRRQKDEGFRAPPDRALIPVPPRARIPKRKAVEQALQSLRLKDESDQLEAAISAIQPAHLEIVTTGRRPGVMFFQHDGLIFGRGTRAFDRDMRFGRPADRGPVAWRQTRAPRSTAFGEFWSPEKPELNRRRATFLAENFVQVPAPGRWDLARLRRFVVARGSMLVVRHDINEAIFGVLLAPVDPANPGKPFFLDAEWNGALTMLASSHSPISGGTEQAIDLVTILAAQGLLSPEARVTLVMAGQRFRFLSIEWEAGGGGTGLVQKRFTLRLHDGDLAGARQALRAATGDVECLLTVELKNASAPAEGTTSVKLKVDPTNSLVDGPPRILSTRLPVAPTDRPFLPIEPATISFGDPAYDREMASKTESARLRDAKGTILLALDRNEYDLGASIQFACGRVVTRPEDDGGQGGDLVWSEGQAGMKVSFGLIRKAFPDKEERLALATAVPESEQADFPDRRYAAKAGVAYSVSIADLRSLMPVLQGGRTEEKNGRARGMVPPDMSAGDRLVVNADFLEGADDGASLRVEVAIVAQPVLAPPAAVYGVVTLDGKGQGARLTTSLFASAPLPQVVEFPDLLGDLAKGHVRRRGLFIWQFVPRKSPIEAEPFAALIKIDRTGGGQTPDTITDFQPAIIS
jgi:hypothetical protein